MKNTYYEIPDGIRVILEGCAIVLSSSLIPNNNTGKRLLEEINESLKTLDQVAEKNKGDYSTDDILQHFESFADFELALERENIKIVTGNKFPIGECWEVFKDGKVLSHGLNVGTNTYAKNAARCFCLGYLIDNKIIHANEYR